MLNGTRLQLLERRKAQVQTEMHQMRKRICSALEHQSAYRTLETQGFLVFRFARALD